MLLTYGQGEYFEQDKHFSGRIILSEHKLYLTDSQGELSATFIPLEKIAGVKITRSGVEIFVRPSILERYQVLLKGDRRTLTDLAKEIAERRGMKKKFLTREWNDPAL